MNWKSFLETARPKYAKVSLRHFLLLVALSLLMIIANLSWTNDQRQKFSPLQDSKTYHVQRKPPEDSEKNRLSSQQDSKTSQKEDNGVKNSSTIKLSPCACERTFPHLNMNNGTSTCSDSATARGPGQKIVSFSFYGSKTMGQKYYEGIWRNAERMSSVYPDWVMRVYHDISPDQMSAGLCNLWCRSPFLDLCYMKELPKLPHLWHHTGSMWRFLPMADPLVDVFLCRDVDSYVSPREATAVQEWLESNKTFHAMRDHPMHRGLMLAGMWGSKVAQRRDFNLRKCAEMLKKGTEKSNKWLDQTNLATLFWPQIKEDILIHDSFMCEDAELNPINKPRPFSTKRPKGYRNFVGSTVALPRLDEANILPILDVQRYGRGGIAWEYLCWSLSNLNCKINGRIPNLLWSVPHFSNLGEQKQVAEVPSSDFKVIHLTDIHSDPEYKGKSFGRRRLQICSEPTGSQNSEILLGEYGNWEGCGIPEKTFQSAVDHIKSVHSDAAYILETGDSAASDFWSQMRAGDLALYQRMKNYLSQQLPGMPVYPVIGNHDTLPVNVFPPMNVRTATPVRWLYQAAAIRWSQLPLTARRTAKWAGVYVIQLPNNLRIITINTLYCYKSNWWVFTKLPDPAYQLEWLRRELQAAEDTKNLVHIVGHVAPGTTECLAVWFHHYAKLVDRYSHIIRGEFYGHQHDHIFNVVHTDRNPSNRLSAKSVAFLGPSLHTLPSLEPAYVVYTIDGTTKRIKELEEWYLDTEDGDKNGVTSWKKLYDFRTTFGSVPENPQEWHDFVQEIKQNETTKELFYNTARRGHSSAPYSLEAADSLVYYLEGYDRH
ncbi:unnamed protein product [Cyprideis torosa]|uniref:Uncharacterized protein n=1 Tax=Cyprideis torosa TaxID=163714 RepID=A0A7R8ZLN3_9CRUS|nr:unnamed protein product [Cyprideis torosa]CAG0884072.1 unnamed protein product [Cyprideis torosa]